MGHVVCGVLRFLRPIWTHKMLYVMLYSVEYCTLDDTAILKTSRIDHYPSMI